MGGRGASSGMSDKEKAYGTEYTTLHRSGNMKFVRYNDSATAKTPMETMTKGRVYVTINAENKPTAITYYDKENKRNKQIDLVKPHRDMLPHTHHGYLHNEYDGKKGATRLSTKEKKMVDRIYKIWHNRIDR